MKKKMKNILLVFFAFFMMMCVYDSKVYALETLSDFNTAPGELLIPFRKIWHEDVREDEKVPIKITLYKYLGETFNINDTANTKIVETIMLGTEENPGWEYNFDISNEVLVDSNNNNYKFIIIEEMPNGYIEVDRKDPVVTFSPPNTSDDFQILSSNSLTNIPLEKVGASTGTIVAATMTSEDKDKFICGPNGNQQCDIIIWTQSSLSPAERVLIARFVSTTGANFKKAVYELNEDGTIKANTVYFISGDGTLGGMSVGTDVDGIEKVMFSETSKWSHVLTGVYNQSQASAIGAFITNNVSRIDLTVKKQWDDHNNILGLRPLEITIQLLKNGNVIDEVKLFESNNWTYTFTGLIEYTNGEKNEYMIKEVDVLGYISDSSVEGNVVTITNTHEVIPTTVSVKKVWNNVGQIGELPGIIVVLYYKVNENDTFREIARVTLNKENNWQHIFSSGRDVVTGKEFDILPENYIYMIKEIEFDVDTDEERTFYEDFFIIDYAHTGNDWIITNTCTASYILPETGSTKTFILMIVTMLLLGMPIIYLIYSFIRRDIRADI